MFKNYYNIFETIDNELLISLFYNCIISNLKILRILYKYNYLITKKQFKFFCIIYDLKRKRELKNQNMQNRKLQKKFAFIINNSIITKFDKKLIYIFLYIN